MEAAKKYKIICLEGGSRSSKTFSATQFFTIKAVQGDDFTVTIARDKFNWVKDTVLQDFKEVTSLYNINPTPNINRNRPEQNYNINGSEFTFWGLDNPAKAHGKKQDWAWINEVMDVNKDAFDQIEMRTKIGLILDYNPIDDQHWVFELQKRPDVCVIHSTMLDNPFNPPTVIAKIKSYEPTPENIAQGTADNYMWEVYGLGKKARLEGAVFTNWDIVDEVPGNADWKGLGLDFGYTNDPSALIELYLYNNEIYLNEIIYEPGLLNSDIAKRMKQFEIAPTVLVMADSSEPKSIEEIRRYGFNIRGVEKGADSINFGIDIMKGYKIHISRNSINLEKEMRRYKWAEDRNGNLLKRNGHGVPIDEYNHAIDAARYIIMTILKKKQEVRLLPYGILG